MDGNNIKHLKLTDYRQLLGIVTKSVLFNDTVYNNILMGKEDASEDEVMRLLKYANAHQFIRKFARTIPNNIGDDGNKLSGGQKQRAFYIL